MKQPKGVVAAGHAVTAQAAAEILEEGGTAFDAALAAILTACVAEPVFASIGGGGFLMAQPEGRGRAWLYDFFPQTPRRKRADDEIGFEAIDADFGPAKQEFHIGLGAAATPGFIAGLFTVHGDLCRLPMRRLAEPAIRAAREGVQITAFQSYLLQVAKAILTASDGVRALFAPDGALLKQGTVFRNVDFAGCLEAIAIEGPRLFSEGEIASAIAAQSQHNCGHLTREDLRSYRVERREPFAWRHKDAGLLLNPAPAAGGTLVALGLGLIESLSHDRAPTVVELARVMEETNAARGRLDGRLASADETALIASELARAAEHWSATRGTTHVSVIDAVGHAAAASVTNGEGNGHVVPGLGFMLNNMLGEEDLNPQGFHRWRPDSRLSSMMAPTLMRDADGMLTALGSGGSNRIRSAILQVVVNLIDRRLALEPAIEAARLHVERDGALSFEDQFPELERAALLAARPQAKAWPEPNMFFGGVHTARRAANGGLKGLGDPRRGGVAIVV